MGSHSFVKSFSLSYYQELIEPVSQSVCVCTRTRVCMLNMLSRLGNSVRGNDKKSGVWVHKKLSKQLQENSTLTFKLLAIERMQVMTPITS